MGKERANPLQSKQESGSSPDSRSSVISCAQRGRARADTNAQTQKRGERVARDKGKKILMNRERKTEWREKKRGTNGDCSRGAGTLTHTHKHCLGASLFRPSFCMCVSFLSLFQLLLISFLSFFCLETLRMAGWVSVNLCYRSVSVFL